jgi:CoA:oxalate CoA-transferase
MGVFMLHRARNKKSITLDLYQPEGRAVFRELCRKADVVVENYAPGVMNEMEAGYAELRTLNPGLILCSISGFGQTGPLRDWRAYDPVIQSMSGLASVTGSPDRPPTRCGAAISDTVAPLFAIIGILSALRRREQGGTGEWVDIAMMDTSFFLQPDLLELLNGGITPQRRGNTHVAGTPLNTYATRDGFVTIAVTTDKNWECLLAALGREDLKADSRFATPLARQSLCGKYPYRARHLSPTAAECLCLSHRLGSCLLQQPSSPNVASPTRLTRPLPAVHPVNAHHVMTGTFKNKVHVPLIL